MKKLFITLSFFVSFFATSVVRADGLPQWAKDLPPVAVTAPVGDSVWATIPQADGGQADVGVYKVDSVAGNVATLVDKIGTQYANVPGALIHALGDATTLKVGDIAIGHAWGAPKVIGHVKTTEAGQVTLHFRWASNMTDKMMDQAQAYVAGVAPLTWVAYDNNGVWYKGLVVALVGDKAWISEDSGFIKEQPKAKLRALTLKGDYKVGDVVKAYSWGFGYQPGTIVSVTEAGSLYKVKIAGKDTPEDYSFCDLVNKI